MHSHRVLLVNPPLVDGVAFTRTGRCQEREGVLGTTKPPYSQAVLAAILREQGVAVCLVDQTADRVSTAQLIRRLERTGFQPSFIVFGSSFPTYDADAAEMTALKRRFNCPIFTFGPHASCAPEESMHRAPDVDGVLVGEPEEAVAALARSQGMDDLRRIDSLCFRANGGVIPHRARGRYNGFPQMPMRAWDLLNVHR